MRPRQSIDYRGWSGNGALHSRTDVDTAVTSSFKTRVSQSPPRAGFLLADSGSAFGQVAYRLPTSGPNEKARYILSSGLSLYYLGWLMGLEPTTTGITILDSTN